MVKFLEEMPFAFHLKNFETNDLVEIVKRFSIKEIKAGERLFEGSDTFSCMYLVLSGLIGVFHID